MNKQQVDYTHDRFIAGHGDVLKHVVLTTVVRELQKKHHSILVSDAMAGDGVYDLNQHQDTNAYVKGVLKVLDKYENDTENTPAPVHVFCDLLLASTGCTSASDLDVYPGSPVLVQNLLRASDEHRLTDNAVDEVQWLKATSKFEALDAFSPNTLEFLMPHTDSDTQHVCIVLDPSYESDADFTRTKQLLTRILDQHPFATVVVWMPLLQNSPHRYAYPNGLKEIAKKHAKGGRYYANIVVAKDRYQGSAVLVCNPTTNLDDVLDDDCVHWLANTMNQGKDEYTIEQIVKKKKAKA